MYIVRADWYCGDDRTEVRDVKIFSAENNEELGKALDKQYGNDLLRFDAHWIGEDNDCIDITEEAARAIEEVVY